MKKVLKNGAITFWPDDAVPANADFVTDAANIIYLDANGKLGASLPTEIPDGCLDVTTRPTPDSRIINGAWIDLAESVPADQPVSTKRFKNSLLGLQVYGGLRVAKIGLSAKFAAGTASPAEVGYLTLLETADGMVSGDSINLIDPAVAMVLDFAVANPHIGYTTADGFIKFDESHKQRVLANVGLGE